MEETPSPLAALLPEVAVTPLGAEPRPAVLVTEPPEAELPRPALVTEPPPETEPPAVVVTEPSPVTGLPPPGLDATTLSSL